MKIKKANRLNEVGEYYFSHKMREINALRDKGMDIINLGIGSPDLAPAKNVIDKLINESQKSENHAYQNYKGIPELRSAFSRWYAKYFQVHLNPENEILPLMGSKEGIMHISMAFLNPGDEVLVPNPGYPAYASVARLLAVNVRYYNLSEEKNWYPDLETLEKADLSKVKIMWVNYPNMPTGTPASPVLFQQLVDFCKIHQILLVNDNPYSFILNENQYSILHIEGAKEIALELNSLSKSHNMAGWRIGMVAGDAEYIQAILQTKSNMDSGMFKPTQMAAVEALQQPKTWYQSLNDIYRQRRQTAFNILSALHCTFRTSQVGMFVWAKIPDNITGSESFSDFVLKQFQIFLTPGFIFGNAGERYVRLSLCTPNERLQEALNRIK